jgi:hypothetical protein
MSDPWREHEQKQFLGIDAVMLCAVISVFEAGLTEWGTQRRRFAVTRLFFRGHALAHWRGR